MEYIIHPIEKKPKSSHVYTDLARAKRVANYISYRTGKIWVVSIVRGQYV